MKTSRNEGVIYKGDLTVPGIAVRW
jgi:hypothetical protein